MSTSSPTILARGFSERDLDVCSTDGFRLSARLFSPAGRARGTVVINAATAAPQQYYQRFARFLAGSGLRTLTYDYRGVGRSAPPTLRGFEASMVQWADRDARAIFRLARSEWAEPVALVGHSFGGQLIGLVDELRQSAGALLVGAQLGYYGYWPLLARPRLLMIWRALVPAATAAYGYLPGKLGLGHDLPYGVAREWARWCSQPGYLLSEQPAARARFAQFLKPVRLYSFTDDDYAPRRAVDELGSLFVNTPIDHRRLDPRDIGVDEVGHFGFFRPRLERMLWGEALEFLNAVIEGRKPEGGPRRRDPPEELWNFDTADVIADLNYGRT
jgi:predicted alpha/beta hydrolase